MIFHMFLGVVATLVLNVKQVTVVDFEHRIKKIATSIDKTRLFKKLSRDKRTLILQPLSKDIEGNLVVMTSGGTYNFDFKHGNAHRSVFIKNGKNDKNYIRYKESSDYILHKSSSSILITNKNKAILDINGQKIRYKKSYAYPLGPPIYLNGKRTVF
ncbi:hypothetical protein A9Q84_00265 [Halobacteriovorax marinus]|uniref:Uncharacterized protein n=1 Tax=Halobacteriovorax marinus TaxID=97084 RepID=A0A1Y5FDB1_9BACT|nr:hypothetical protein A9Q84_00265 [Halobacteriovorax marinus]